MNRAEEDNGPATAHGGGWGGWAIPADDPGRVVDPPVMGRGDPPMGPVVWHAVRRMWTVTRSPACAPHTDPEHLPQRLRGQALCGVQANPPLMFPVPEFDPDRYREPTCPSCGWWHAIRTSTTAARLARLGAGPGRRLAVAVAEAILTGLDTDGGPEHVDDVDVADAVGLLDAVAAHAGAAVIGADCARGSCDHTLTRGGCPPVGWACDGCSLPDPHEDHRYRHGATVAPPCSVLLTIAAGYRIHPRPDLFPAGDGGPFPRPGGPS